LGKTVARTEQLKLPSIFSTLGVEVVFLRRHGKRVNEESDQRHVLRSRQSCRHRWLRDLSDGCFHGRCERQSPGSVRNITCLSISIPDMHLSSTLSATCGLHDAARALFLHLFELCSTSFHGERSAFPATTNRLETDHWNLSPHVALYRFGWLRNSHLGVEMARSSAMAKFFHIAEALHA
jgi:hypothetical protein